MIKLDLSNAVTETSVQKYAENVQKLIQKINAHDVVGHEFLGWKDLPNTFNPAEAKKIKDIAARWKKEGINTLVVIGIGGSFVGAKAAVEMVQGFYPVHRDMEIIWAGESMSATDLASKLKHLENKSFAINVISKSGTTTEPAVAFRIFLALLEERYGAGASKRVVATTDANRGTLRNMALANKWEMFTIPDNIGGRFSVLTAVGMFPMACAGLDIDAIMHGAKKGWKLYSNTELKSNPAYQYAVARHILKSKFPIELMVQYEPQMRMFSEWWKQLSGESEGKAQQGLFPASVVFSTDLHSLGQYIQEGAHVLFETVMTVQTPQFDVHIPHSVKNQDNLNYLSSHTVQQINDVVFKATTDAHVHVAKVPNIHLSFPALNESSLGELFVFFMHAIMMSAYLANINPFNQPGVEIYKQNMFKVLGKPE